MTEPELDWETIAALRSFPAVTFTLGDPDVDAYLDATGEAHPLYAPGQGGFVPPLYATQVRLVKRSLGGRWPSGTVQLDHRIATYRALRRGEALTLDARISRAELRNGRAYFQTVSQLKDAGGSIVGEQSSLSMWAGAPAPTGTSRSAPAPERPRPRPDIGPVSASFPLAAVRAFGAVAGALDPIHVDPEFAKGTRFGVNIAQGRLVMTLLSRLMLERFGVDWLNGNELAVRFVRPVLVGETIVAWGAAREDDPAGLAVWCENASGDTVIGGTARAGT